MKSRWPWIIVLSVTGLFTGHALAGPELITRRDGNAVSPRRVEATPERIAQLRVPPGFAVNVFARGLGAPRMFAVGPDGSVYVTRRSPGDVVRLRDLDGNGVADEVRRVVTGLDDVHGIAIRGRWIYLATPGDVHVAPLIRGRVGPLQRIIQGIPAVGRHRTRSLGFGPDGGLYISVGSTGNANIEDHPWSAAILRANAGGGNVRVFARGLRNTVGFGWHPTTGQMWGMDHGIDWLGDTVPPEELNRLVAGAHYGWPLVYGRNELTPVDRDPGAGVDVAAWRARSTPMARGYPAHTAPIGLAFYTGNQFPPSYRGDAFVAFHGSWNRDPPAGYELVRVDFDVQGRPIRFVPFVSGFLLPGPAHFGRPAGVVMLADGSLLLGDDANGVLYRIRYVGR